MKFKFLLLFAFLLLVIPFASADSLVFQRDFENNSVNGWVTNADTSVSVESGTPLLGTYSAKYLSTKSGDDGEAYHLFVEQSTNTTINFLFKKGGGDTKNKGVWIADSGATPTYNNAHYMVCFDNDNWKVYDGGSYQDTGYSCVDDQTYNLTVHIHSFGASSLASYKIDGTLYLDNITDRGTVTAIDSIGISGFGPAYIDQISVCTGNWVTGYNCDNGTTPTPPPSNASVFINVTANNNYGNVLTVFNATINGVNYATTNGTINTGLNASLQPLSNITIYAENYFPYDYSGVNLSNGLFESNASFQTDIDFDVFTKVTNNKLFNFTISDGVLSESTTNGNTSLKFLSNVTNVTFTNIIGYYNTSKLISLSPLDNKTINITGIYDSIVTLSFFNYSSNKPINNLTGKVSQFVEGFTETFSSVGNTTTVNLLKNYEYSFYLNGSPHYTEAHSSNTFLKTLNESTHSYNWSLFRDRSLIIDFSDILTNQEVLGVSLLLLGNTTNYVLFANTSPFSYFVGLDLGAYSLLANKTGYTDFSASTNIYDGVLTNISASITGEATEVSIFVRNIFDQYLSDAGVEVYRASDNSFVSSGSTDSSGGIKFALSDRITYDVYFVKEGYINLSGTLSVADTIYTFTLVPSNTYNPSYYKGIDVSFSPLSTLLVNGTVYNFSSSFTSTWWNVSSMYLYSYQGSYLANTSIPINRTGAGAFTASSGTYTITNFNASDVINTYYTLRLIMTLDDGTNISYYKTYFLDLTYKGDSSLAVALESTAAFDGAGFSNDDRFFWYVVFMLVVTFGAASVGNFISDPEKILLLLTILSAIGSLFGFLTIGWISASVGVSEGWFLTTLLGVAALFSLLNKKGGS